MDYRKVAAGLFVPYAEPLRWRGVGLRLRQMEGRHVAMLAPEWLPFFKTWVTPRRAKVTTAGSNEGEFARRIAAALGKDADEHRQAVLRMKAREEWARNVVKELEETAGDLLLRPAEYDQYVVKVTLHGSAYAHRGTFPHTVLVGDGVTLSFRAEYQDAVAWLQEAIQCLTNY